MISIQVKRSGTFNSRLSRVVRRLESGFERGANLAGDLLLEKSKELCPKDTMTLVNDGHKRQEGDGFETVIIVGYGTYDYTNSGVWSPREGKNVDRTPADYAKRQHETHAISDQFLEHPRLFYIGDFAGLIFQEMTR